MKKNSLIFVLGLVPLIPCSSRFGYGILLSIEYLLLFFALIVSNKLVEIFEIKNSYAKKSFSLIFTMAVAIFFLSFVAILFPVTELTLRFYIYFVSFSYILILCVDDYFENYQSFSLLSFYICAMLIFSFIRELIFFGSISFLTPSSLFSIQIIPTRFLVFKFFGTNGGSFILLASVVWIYFSVKKGKIIPFTE